MIRGESRHFGAGLIDLSWVLRDEDELSLEPRVLRVSTCLLADHENVVPILVPLLGFLDAERGSS
jgi:hypothetical protein